LPDNNIKATVIEHTRFLGEELITVEVEFHRFILAQINTHKALSRNYQSSRAMPVSKMIAQVKDNPAMPVTYAKAQRGMVAGDTFTERDQSEVEAIIDNLRLSAIDASEKLLEAGLSKEIANRYLEPWMYTKGVITASKDAWEAVFKLRCEYDAQPEIQELCCKIREGISNSVARALKEGGLHLPYVDVYTKLERENGSFTSSGMYLAGERELTPRQAVEASVATCAQVSYRTLDQSEEKVNRIYEMLKLPENGVYKKEAPHFSAAEHIARADSQTSKTLSGNFHSSVFQQYRKVLECGAEALWFPSN